MKTLKPCCPNCKSDRYVGKVKTFINGKSANGYYCSQCLIEFDKDMKMLPPLWIDFKEEHSVSLY